MKLRVCVLGLMILGATGCGSSDVVSTDMDAGQANTDAAAEAPLPSVAKVKAPQLAKVDQERVCRAGIAALNGHSPGIMKASVGGEDTIRITYARPDDGKIWKNECRIEGDRLVWRTVDAFGPGSGTGRWRTHPADEVISYRVDGDKVTITMRYEDGSETSEVFTIA